MGVTCLICASPAAVFCENDDAYLCRGCDTQIHSNNAVVARHERFPVCEVCSSAASTVFCRNDAAHLCSGCDCRYGSNPLAATHEVIPLKLAPKVRENSTPPPSPPPPPLPPPLNS